jgi:hypothetical protein
MVAVYGDFFNMFGVLISHYSYNEYRPPKRPACKRELRWCYRHLLCMWKDPAQDRLTQMKKDPNRRIDSDNMTEVEKMDAGFTHGTYNINGRDVDF